MTDSTQTPAALYANAIALEKVAWQALQAQAPGSGREQAWAKWSEAIARTNRAWRQLGFEEISAGCHAQDAVTHSGWTVSTPRR
jgi:hypothetical protein